MAITVHWKAPLQTKGFLKIIELLVAILCFSLVASYSYHGSQTCTYGTQNHTLTIETSYPLFSYILKNVTLVPINPNPSPVPLSVPRTFDNINIGQGAQFFVTWGVASMLYCIVALFVYMVFTANEQFERIMDMLVYADLVFHVLWVFFWFVACVDWAVSYNQLSADVDSLLSGPNCPVAVGQFSHASTAQAGISVVFGFLSMFLWGVNVFWVVIDTPFYIQWKANRNSGSNYQPTP